MDDYYKYVIPDTSGIQLAPKIRTSRDITPASIERAMAVWSSYANRYESLFYAYVGHSKASIYSQLMDETLNTSEYSTISNYCGYIVKTIKGFMAGNPPAYECSEEDTYGRAICDMYKAHCMGEIDAHIIKDMSIYGRAFELVYRDEKDGTPRSTVISPRDAFVAYSGDLGEDSVFGAVRYAEPQDDGSTLYRLYLYTDTEEQIWESQSATAGWVMMSSRPHGMGRVPLIEYCNNDEYMGDFEGIIALQNLYNRTMLNRVADKDAFVRSILVVVGQVIGKTPDEIESSLENLNKNRVLQLDDGSTASFLEHTMDETGIQVLQDQIKSDIHKFAFVPDLSDEQFSNNASGVAMAYKLFGTSQIVVDKDGNFQKGFSRRCKLYDAILNNPAVQPGYTPKADISQMHCIFKYNSPQDLSYMATALTTLVGAGILSKDTARKNLSIVADAESEAEKVGQESEADAEIQRLSFEADFTESAPTEDTE